MPEPGAVLGGRYRLDERIGAGGMGEVWRATDQRLDRTVAVKLIRPGLLADPGFLARFRNEARVMASIEHPNVVAVHDFSFAPTVRWCSPTSASLGFSPVTS